MKPDPEIVALLEEELERAKSGETTGILVLITEDKTLGTAGRWHWAGKASLSDALYAIEMWKHQVCSEVVSRRDE